VGESWYCSTAYSTVQVVYTRTCATSDSNGTVQRRRSQRAAELSLALLPAPGQRRVKVTEKGGVAVKRACAPRCHVPGAALWPMALASKRRPAPCMHVPRRLGWASLSATDTPRAGRAHNTHSHACNDRDAISAARPAGLFLCGK
jgi:hypothetical protein